MAKKVRVQIFPDGRIQAKTEGIKGRKCTEYIRILEEILEAETVESEYTAEYYVTEEASTEVIQEQSLREEN